MGRSSQMTGPFGGRRWIRTIEAKTQQIYSLPPLATREFSQLLYQLSYASTKSACLFQKSA